MRAIAINSILVLGVSLLTSDFAPPVSAQDRPTFRSNSELVVLHVSVRDSGGRYITGLTKDSFTVIDDAKPQSLEMFSADEVPATVGFLIDNSNSMRPSRERVVASAVAFAQHSRPEDEIFALAFNEAVQEVWRPTFVSDINPAEFASAMSTAIVARGMTAIYDGIMSGLSRLEHARHTRQVLILVSDGGDNASRAKLEDTIARVRDSDATVYTVVLVDPLIKDGNPKLLRRLARLTGGQAYQPRRVAEVTEAFERISTDIRNAYTLAYVPTKSENDMARRRRAVKVYVRSPDGRVLSVRTRDGYFEKTSEEQR